MPHFRDFFSKSQPPKLNLQDGLFQIASQTCNLLVQVNNTNNISYGNNATNIHMNNLPPICSSRNNHGASNGDIDSEQLVVLLPPTNKNVKYKPGSFGKPRLSTVLEGPPIPNDEEADVWGQGYMTPADATGSPRRWGQKTKWCRPSCIPISIICILIFLVVLLPLLDHATEKALQKINSGTGECNSCRISLRESIPIGLEFPGQVTYPSTFDTWLDLINSAQHTIEIASFYWTLRQSEVYPDPSSIKGEQIFQSLLKAGTDRGIDVKIAQNYPSPNFPNIDTELLVRRKAATVRSLNFPKLMGGGVLHTKFWIIDRQHAYIGSANMDWRSLTQVKEMGIALENCPCMARDLGKIFDVYWTLGEDGAKIPDTWPTSLSTDFNMETPFNLMLNNETFQSFISSSPPPFSTTGRTNDIDALVNVIQKAEKFIYIAVMDYYPQLIYSPKKRFWPVIDDALKSAAIDHKVKVKMLISRWNHTRTSEDYFLRSLASITGSYPGVSLEVRHFIVPSDQKQIKIPDARVNHNKYMVTDNTAYIGTSNWSGDYFTDTAGIAFVLHDPVYDRDTNHTTIRSELQGVFERDWNSNYSYPVYEDLLDF